MGGMNNNSNRCHQPRQNVQPRYYTLNVSTNRAGSSMWHVAYGRWQTTPEMMPRFLSISACIRCHSFTIR